MLLSEIKQMSEEVEIGSNFDLRYLEDRLQELQDDAQSAKTESELARLESEIEDIKILISQRKLQYQQAVQGK